MSLQLHSHTSFWLGDTNYKLVLFKLGQVVGLFSLSLIGINIYFFITTSTCFSIIILFKVKKGKILKIEVIENTDVNLVIISVMLK